jgi:hypothetical protein
MGTQQVSFYFVGDKLTLMQLWPVFSQAKQYSISRFMISWYLLAGLDIASSFSQQCVWALLTNPFAKVFSLDYAPVVT